MTGKRLRPAYDVRESDELDTEWKYAALRAKPVEPLPPDGSKGSAIVEDWTKEPE